MKTPSLTQRAFQAQWLVIALTFFGWRAVSADSVRLEMRSGVSAPTPVLEWHGSTKLPFNSSQAEYTILQSSDLTSWRILESSIQGTPGLSDETMRKVIANPGGQSFYRVLTSRKEGAISRAGESIYGYAEAFSKELQALGQLPLETFSERYTPTNEFLPRITFDPTTADYWSAFNTDPAVFNATNATLKRFSDFRFTPEEKSIFQTNGFVVSGRLGGYSFANAFYKVYFDDLPVFISTDAILQAWHFSYQKMLEEMEETYLAPQIGLIITNMLAQLPVLKAENIGDDLNGNPATPLFPALLDAEYFLGVAKALLSGAPGTATRINTTLADIAALTPKEVVIFGRTNFFDFSQFTVRGHYEASVGLQRYFRTMMWLALCDFRLIDRAPTGSWEFADIVALNVLLDRANARLIWSEANKILSHFVGLGDAMNFNQVNDLLVAGNVAPPYNQLPSVYAQIMASDLGVQNIRGGLFESPLGVEQIKLPRAFAFMPQRFTLDSWALSKVVFDDIIWDEDGIPDLCDKVFRRIPSALDVAFSVLGNDSVAPIIAQRINNKAGREFRDGLPYQHNLAAVRKVVDQQNDSYWTNSIYAAWTASLRSLSAPTTAPKYPEAMRTRAWSAKTLNTQLASWTHLRHDTVLYAKQSYTGLMGCSYPKGYVEPRVEFWEKLQQMATTTRDLMGTLRAGGTVTVVREGDQPITIHQFDLRARRVTFLNDFIATVGTLKTIAEKELNNGEFTEAEKLFLEEAMEQKGFYSVFQYSGWYPNLFYKPIRQQVDYTKFSGSDQWDALVTDVHTDGPSVDDSICHADGHARTDPGAILHEGVGNVHMLFMVVDCADGSRNMYAGPVLSHYEFETPFSVRKTDTSWKADLKAGAMPPSPEWTRGYLAPGAITLPVGL